ncbi:LysM peptidoglycan-binding domain-containing protein [Desulfobacula sp.]|uniref:LysM peptidoglycan-binding domain-containing protein n=1 Tax=Desulfobacula sp. TaxID=2593537 RepID=UPI00260E4640|nr:LysM peptidoglycan-binding domain-containing protein [Desulfobacula sp.]
MKPKGNPESKTPTTKTNINGQKTIGAALLNKNEFTLIILGALLLTIIIFFLFFRSSDPKVEPVQKIVLSTSFTDLEKRIEKIEQALQLKEMSSGSARDNTEKGMPGIDPIKERVTRLETAFSVKFDALIERMGKIENSISLFKNKPAATVVTPKPEPKLLTPIKKALKKEKKVSMFHTVQKGETLYSISKKYNTSIAGLLKLNNLSADAKIYPGNKIIVR